MAYKRREITSFRLRAFRGFWHVPVVLLPMTGRVFVSIDPRRNGVRVCVWGGGGGKNESPFGRVTALHIRQRPSDGTAAAFYLGPRSPQYHVLYIIPYVYNGRKPKSDFPPHLRRNVMGTQSRPNLGGNGVSENRTRSDFNKKSAENITDRQKNRSIFFIFIVKMIFFDLDTLTCSVSCLPF